MQVVDTAQYSSASHNVLTHSLNDNKYCIGKIELNINKRKFVSYGRIYPTDHSYSYHIDKAQLEQLDSIKDLGVTFDSQLTFDKHIDDKTDKADSFLGIIGQIVYVSL